MTMEKGASKDPASAHSWYNVAGENGEGAAQDYRLKIEDNMTSSQIKEGTRRAQACLKSNYEDCD